MRNYLLGLVALVATACSYNTPATYVNEGDVQSILDANNGRLYTIEELKDSFMTEVGNCGLDSLYRVRAHADGTDYWVFNLDTLPEFGADGKRLYIQGRLVTDDYGGNFYKTLILQQIVGGKQQCLRIGVDIGSASGLYEKGQVVLIALKGLCLGRYANQEQLCVPSYNNNTLAGENTAKDKVGWAPGRIPGPMFRKAASLIGLPDPKKIKVDSLTLQEMWNNYLPNYTDVKGCRQYDGRVVCVKDVHFNGLGSSGSVCQTYKAQFDNTDNDAGNPEKDSTTNVFAPTTNNLGFPPSRMIVDAYNNKLLVSTSEYAKFAHYYLPSDTTMKKRAQDGERLDSVYMGRVEVDGITYDKYLFEDSVLYDIEFAYDAVQGNITGILGYYLDTPSKGTDWSKWSITGESLEAAFDMKNTARKDANGNPTKWTPIEFAISNFYRNKHWIKLIPVK